MSFQQNDIVFCPSAEIQQALINYAKEKGILMKGELSSSDYDHYPNLVYKENGIDGNCTERSTGSYRWLAIDNFIKKCDEYKDARVESITQEYNAIVTKEGIQVGCQKVTWEKFDELVRVVNKWRTL